MEKYYLIEEYETINTDAYGRWEGITKYEVRKFETSEQLKEAILKGPLHKGKLIPTKDLELKLQIIEDEQDKNEELRQDIKKEKKPTARQET